MPRPIDELILLISEFPGIGPRQARRIVQFLLTRNPSFVEKLATLMRDVKKSAVQCAECFRYTDSAVNGLCRICADEDRDTKLLMLVEKDVDIDGVESAGAYRGRYFVLGGLIPMTQRKNAPVLRTKELSARIQKNGIEEVILALSTTPEGDYTAQELITSLKTLPSATSLKVSILGRGLSVGAEIEYADSETLRNAFRNRH